jgi:outer membrane protein OmpA-like peptidoglycan-associated protein
MLSSESGGQPRGVKRRVQAGCGLESGTSGLRPRLVPLALLVLTGCSSLPASINPVSWWHDLQGGKIAEARPPPPGTDQPYPNLSTVPAKPDQPDREALANIANALIADRTNAQHVAAGAPIADPSLPSASPGLFGRGTAPPPAPAPPPGAQTTSATLPAAEAPPAPPTPPTPPTPPAPAAAAAPAVAPAGGQASVPAPATAPVGNVESTPLTPPGSTALPPAVAAAPPPPLPTSPPPPPNLPAPGAAAPRPTAAAAAPSAPPPPAAPTAAAEATPASPPASADAADTVSVTFITGSATLPPSGAGTLRDLAARRGSGIIAVTGYGDATSDDPAAQSSALTLALSRAQAMAAVLTAAGVPSTAVQVDSVAVGRGGAARLVQ